VLKPSEENSRNGVRSIDETPHRPESRRRKGDGDRGESRTIQGVDDEAIELSHVRLDAGRGGTLRGRGASLFETVSGSRRMCP